MLPFLAPETVRWPLYFWKILNKRALFYYGTAIFSPPQVVEVVVVVILIMEQ